MLTTHNNKDRSTEGHQLGAMVASVKAAGLLQPILTDRAGTIIDRFVRFKACGILGIEPWMHVIDPIPSNFRAHSFVRRSPRPLELADMVASVRAEENPGGARRAPGTGRTQAAVARRMTESFGLRMSARQVSHAIALTALPAAEREAIERADPESMRAAQKALIDHRLGPAADGSAKTSADQTDLFKRGNEFRAAAIRCGGRLTDADRAMLQALRTVIDELLVGDAHATP